MNFLEQPIRIDEQIWAEDVKPLVSISCITYNHEKFISDAIEGFLMQETTFPVEINIHDDASTDNTAIIIREYEKKYPHVLFNVIYQTENQYSKRDGSIRKIQHGRARGRYYAICEGDDYWIDPLKLQKQVGFLEENEEYGLVHTDAHVYIQKTKKLSRNINRTLDNDLEVYTQNKEKLFKSIVSSDYRIRTASVVHRKKYLKDLKFESWFQMGDTPTWLQLSQITKFKYFDKPTTVYRVLENSASNFTNRVEKLKFQMNGAEMRYYFVKKYGYSLNTLSKSYNKKYIELKSYVYNYPLRYPLINPTVFDKCKLSIMKNSFIRKVLRMYYNYKYFVFIVKKAIIIR